MTGRTSGSRFVRWGLLAVLLVVFLWLPFQAPFNWNLTVAANALIFGLAATSVNLALGLGGILNLGSAFFLGTGAYGTALAVTKFGWPFVPAAIAAVAASVVVAVVVGVLLLNMPRFYLAVATLGLSVALEGVLLAYHTVTGGDSGIIADREISFGVFTVASDRGWYILVVCVCALSVALVHRATRGRRGRLLAMIRSDELAANVLGLRVLRAKVTVFAASAALLATAGVLLFAFAGVIVPATAGVQQSVQLLGMSVVGGMGYVSGGIVGACLLYWLQSMVSGIGTYQSLIYGAAFVIVVFFVRPGIAGLAHGLWQRAWRRSDPRDLDTATEVGEPGMPGYARSPAIPADPAAPDGTVAEAGPAPRRVRVSHQRWTAADPSIPGLVADRVVKRFGGLTAVDEVSLVVPSSAITGLIGTNGAGKSTFLNLVSGVEALDAGTIFFNGRNLANSSPAERASAGVARTFQTPRLVDHCTVLENVMIGRDAADGVVFRRQRRDEESTNRDEAMHALERVGLATMAGRLAGTLGSGERKFVELVRALVLKPQVLLMDEPAVGLSLDEVANITRWIEEIAQSGTAVLLIDHNMDFISGLTDYVYSMDSGRIVASGPVDAAQDWTRSWHSIASKGAAE